MGHSSLSTLRQRRGGFALLITITLLAFLVLLLVSLAALTRVETQVASNNQQLAQARQNALMALNIAVGQLQKYAGPDQRTTARADLENGATVPNARWTGVYGNAIAPDYAQIPSEVATAHITPANINTTTGSPARLLTWLVSGNESGTFNPAADVGAKGEITATSAALAGGVDFIPTVATTDLTDSATTDTPITITDSNGTVHKATMLVGPGSTRTAVPNGRAIDYVAAPLMNIEVPESTLPGFPAGSNAPRSVGRYAWWVGDEGVKARVNLPLVDTVADKPNAFVSSSRAAIELMNSDVLSEPPPALIAPRIDAAYDPSLSVDNIVSAKQLPLVSTTPATLTAAAQFRFHDITAHSTSVLADAYAGGLKRDLSRLLAPGYAPSATDSTSDDKTLYASEEGTTYTMPTWGHLRDFATTTVTVTAGIPEPLAPRLPVFNTSGKPDKVGISPVLTYVGLGFRYAAASAPATGVTINFNLYPVVVLWNPYTTRMKAETYEVGIGQPGYATRMQLQMEDPALINPSNAEAAWVVKETRDIRYAARLLTANQPTDRPMQYFRFLVQCPEMKAGESIVFTLPSNTTYTQDTATPCATTLEPGLNPTTFASISGTKFEAGESTRRFRFTTSGAMMKPHFNTGSGSGVQFSNGGGGGFHIYLGKPRTTAQSLTSATQVWTPSENTWYQANQSIGYDTSTVINPLQGPDILGPAGLGDEPGLKLFVTTVFSSTGSARTANKGTIPWIRWLAQTNIRAPYSFRTRRDPNYSTSYIAQVGTDANMWPTWFSTNSPGDRASAGLSHDWDTTTDAPVKASLFEFRHSDQPLLSIGQLQHANLSLAGTYPAYAVGNSIADFRFTNLSEIATRNATFTTEPVVPQSPNALQRVYYDISWLLNRSLWDRFYFSTVPDIGDPTVLANRRHSVHNADKDLRDPNQAAAGLMLSGGFNINSTSEQAWRAILGGVNKLVYDPVIPSNPGDELDSAFPRFSRPIGGTTIPTGSAPTLGTDLPELWNGYRVLSDEQIAQLARNIVTQIRLRGPFVSLSDFINRRLINNPSTTTADERLKGTLQAAIDATTQTNAPDAFASNDTSAGSYWNAAHRVNSLPWGDHSKYSLEAARGDSVSVPEGAYRRNAAFAPKFLTQADVLSTIGAGLSARSDTFLVRTYGEAINPVTGTSSGRAWCEAVVQRMPEYVAPSADNPEATPTNTSNRNFGRKFQIISFRWLSPSDI